MRQIENLDAVRQKIDMIDDVLVEGLAKRFELLENVAEIKSKLGMDIESEARERRVKDRVAAALSKRNAQDYVSRSVIEIYDAIINESKRIQQKLTEDFYSQG